MRKQLVYIFSILLFLVIVQAKISEINDMSGIKLAVDFTDINLLKKLNYTSLFFNKTLLADGLNIGNGGFLGYQLNIGNISIGHVIPPQEADIVPIDVETNTPSIKVSLKNFYIKILTDYSVQISLYKDVGIQNTIEINATQLTLDITLNKTSKHLKVNHCLLDLNSLEINFNGKILNALYWMLKKTIISTIKNNVEALSSTIEKIINEASSHQILYNIDGFKIIGLNLTITDKPDLIFHNNTSLNTIVKTNTPNNKFLNQETIVSTSNTSIFFF